MAWVMRCTSKLGRILGTRSRCLHTTNPLNIVIPSVIEQSGGTERAFDIFSRLLRERIVCVFGPISDSSAALVIAQLIFLQSESTKKVINMYINSPGGSVTAGLAIYDTMQYIQAPVATWCVGQACSMGSLLLCAGSSGQRHSLPNSRIMIHQPSGEAGGTATNINIQAEEIIRMKKQTNQIYYKHSKLPMEKIDSGDYSTMTKSLMYHRRQDRPNSPTSITAQSPSPKRPPAKRQRVQKQKTATIEKKSKPLVKALCVIGEDTTSISGWSDIYGSDSEVSLVDAACLEELPQTSQSQHSTSPSHPIISQPHPLPQSYPPPLPQPSPSHPLTSPPHPPPQISPPHPQPQSSPSHPLTSPPHPPPQISPPHPLPQPSPSHPLTSPPHPPPQISPPHPQPQSSPSHPLTSPPHPPPQISPSHPQPQSSPSYLLTSPPHPLLQTSPSHPLTSPPHPLPQLSSPHPLTQPSPQSTTHQQPNHPTHLPQTLVSQSPFNTENTSGTPALTERHLYTLINRKIDVLNKRQDGMDLAMRRLENKLDRLIQLMSRPENRHESSENRENMQPRAPELMCDESIEDPCVD